MAKNWYKSKTMWINLLVVISGVLTAIAGELTAAGTLTVIGIVNIVIRKITTEKIK